MININFDDIIEEYDGYIWKLIRKEINKFNTGSYGEDYYQEALVGLYTATTKFDVSKGYKFLTFATPWIFKAIRRFTIDNAFLIRTPNHIWDKGKVKKHNFISEFKTNDGTQDIYESIQSKEDLEKKVVNKLDLESFKLPAWVVALATKEYTKTEIAKIRGVSDFTIGYHYRKYIS